MNVFFSIIHCFNSIKSSSNREAIDTIFAVQYMGINLVVSLSEVG